MKDKFNRIFDKKSNSNILHGYKTESYNMSQCCGLLLPSLTAPRIKRDSEPADWSCGQPINSAGCSALCSACSPHNDMIFLPVITRKDDKQLMKGLGQRDVVIQSTEHQCYSETLTRICNVHSSSRTNSALSQRERAKNEKNLLPYCLNALLPKKQAAFTLTEVLLAVLIVGIIAAMVLPAIVTKYQDKAFESAFNREVHSLQDSIDSLAAVENQPSFYETTLATDTGAYMKKYLRVSKFCETSGKDCFGKFYSEYSGHEKKTYTPSYAGNCAILKNGTSVCLNVNGGSIDMLIDVNGPKGPNVLGRDLRTYTHTVRGKDGYDMSSSGIIALNQPPIKDSGSSDPCEGMTCGCGDLPDCDPCAGKTCGCGSLPPCETGCSATDTSLNCCKKRTITGESDACCKWSYYDNNTTCHPKHDYTVTLDYYTSDIKTSRSFYIRDVSISPNSIPSSDFSKLDVVIKYWNSSIPEDAEYNCRNFTCINSTLVKEMPASYLKSIQDGSCRGYRITSVERGEVVFGGYSAHRMYWKQSGSTVYKIGNNTYTLRVNESSGNASGIGGWCN